MSPYLFDELLQHIETDDIHKEATFMWEPILPKVKLVATVMQIT